MGLQVAVNKQGMVFIKGLEEDPGLSYLRKAQKSEWYWSSWYWLPELKRDLKLRNVSEAVVDDFKERRERLEQVKRRKLQMGRGFFDRVFTTKLWDLQIHAATVAIAARKFYLADAVGLGKTLSSFAPLVYLREKGIVHSALIVCTSSVKHQWKYEMTNALRPEFVDRYDSVVVEGTKQTRRKIYQAEIPIKIINYESLRVDVKDTALLHPDLVILDEAWKVKNARTKIHKAVRKTIQGSRYVFALNAAPVGNGYEDLFGVVSLLDDQIFLSWNNFERRYVNYQRFKRFKKIRGYRNVEDLKKRVSHIMLRRTVKDVGTDVPDLLINSYWVDLTKEQRKDYERLKSQRNGDIAVHNLARICCLFSKNTPVEETPKYKELVRFLTEVIPHEKAIVFSESKSYLKAVRSARGFPNNTAIISGDVGGRERADIQSAFVKGNTRVLLLTAAGEAGLNLQEADVIINLDIPWNPERLRQRIGRVRPHLGSRQRRIRVINVLARDTIEERVVSRVIEKIGHFSKLFDEECEDLTGVFHPLRLDELL